MAYYLKNNTKEIKLIILDVDGTLTDGSIYIDNNGLESKAFNVKDGLAIVEAERLGMLFAIITGRDSKIVQMRAEELKIKEIHQAVKNKLSKLDELAGKYNLSYDEIAYMGDDINDLPIINKVGLSGAPKDSVQEIKETADLISSSCGGKGAVREFIEYILKKNGQWNKVLAKYK